MICGGILLFVAANWDGYSPAERFTLVVLMVAVFHVGGALSADRFRAMADSLHTVGTVALGAGIALAGQIFNLQEHWPGGIMLWAAGAAIGWAILRQTPQMVLLAILLPSWLAGEWIVAAGGNPGSAAGFVIVAGAFLLALSYFTAAGPGPMNHRRRALMLLGATALAPEAALVAVTAADAYRSFATSPVSNALYVVGWSAALIGPIVLAIVMRGLDAWPNVVAALWLLILMGAQATAGWVAVYAWWGAGAVGLVAWGIRDARTERVNMGAIAFAATVLVFYFSQVMDKMGRSASLIGLGALFLGGGWLLERSRRQLVERARRTP